MIWPCSNLIIEHHSDGAEFCAASRADDQGDMEGNRVWLRILEKIEELQRYGPGINPAPRHECWTRCLLIG